MKMKKKENYNKSELFQFSNGEFGPKISKLPLPPMLMIDRINKISENGGKYNKGQIIAEMEINPKLWFFDCHFKDDPVMPGCLGLDAMWQLVGFYLGWTGEPGKGRALGVNNVKFTGEVLKNVKIARYQVDMKRILKKKGTVVGLANGLLYADDKAIYEAENLKVGLFK